MSVYTPKVTKQNTYNSAPNDIYLVLSGGNQNANINN